MHFKTLVENQFGVKIKTLRTDGGGEYVNNSFKSACLDHGIHHQLSCPYTPQQNGVAERKHKHIVESVLSMLYQSNLPSSYWCYAFSKMELLKGTIQKLHDYFVTISIDRAKVSTD